MPAHPAWTEITPSPHPWEREAIAWLQAGLPHHEPHRAWSNFEFLADDGTLNEVDALILTPRGLFLVEIKSHPGKVRGDQVNWTWERDGKRSSIEPPFPLANRKAKRLASLLARQPAFREANDRPPFVEALIFLSDAEVEVALERGGEHAVVAREKRGNVRGIWDVLLKREGAAVDGPRGGAERRIDKPKAKLVRRALEQASVQRSQKARRVGDYQLLELVEDSPAGTFQEWRAKHKRLPGRERAVRIFTAARIASEAERKRLVQAAEREARILEGLRHPGIGRLESFTETELGPALVLERPFAARRLDRVVRELLPKKSRAERLAWLREVAEALAYAQKRHLVHRSLAPSSLWLVPEEDAAGNASANVSAGTGSASAGTLGSPRERLVIFNWAVGGRSPSTSLASSTLVATVHAEELLEDEATAYLAPETFSLAREFGPAVDVFSLGALAYLFFAEKAPASGQTELRSRLAREGGLRLSAEVDGVPAELEELIHRATRPLASERFEDADEFLSLLSAIEKQLAASTSGEERCANPLEAKAGDRLQHGWTVVERLGSGSSSVVFLVERGGQELVLKLASRPEHSERLRGEAEILQKLRHPRFLELKGTLEFEVPGFNAPLFGLLLPRVEQTLAKRLRDEGPLYLDHLQRFGADLLEGIAHLEDVGIAHRDVKPENLGLVTQGRANEQHLVLFDFSLSQTPPEQLRAGTPGYLDPFLEQRRPRRWDLAAERYAAAVTLHEMTSGMQPRWGDGQSDPALLSGEVTLQAESYPAELREGLSDFFARALRRAPKERFDNALEMRAAWLSLFEAAEKSSRGSRGPRPMAEAVLLPAEIGPETPLAAIDFGTRAQNALDRLNLLTVQDLLCFPSQRLWSLRGVGQKTRKQIATAVLELRKRPWAAALRPGLVAAELASSEPAAPALDPVAASLEEIASALLPSTKRVTKAQRFRCLYLGFEQRNEPSELRWPTQREAALRAGLAEGSVGKTLSAAREEWRELAALTPIRDALVELLRASAGVLPLEAAANAIAAARGSALEEPLRTAAGIAVLRAALEAESVSTDPRFLARRRGDRVLLVLSQDHGTSAEKLGALADRLATEDPLPSSKRALEVLRAWAPVPGTPPLADGALLRLAASLSERAAVSSRLELYPRGLSAERSLRLSQSTLLSFEGALREDELRQRVKSRYPEAAPLPTGEALAALLRVECPSLEWQAATQSFRVKRNVDSGYSLSTHSSLLPKAPLPAEPSTGILSDEATDHRLFEKKLRHYAKDGGLLVLSTAPKSFVAAEQALVTFLAGAQAVLERCDLDALIVRAMHAAALANGIDWQDTVLLADAPDASASDRANLHQLFHLALPEIEAALLAPGPAIRLVRKPGLLARYGALRIFALLKERAGRRGAVPSLWFLLPSSQQSSVPRLFEEPLPISVDRHLRIPESWPRQQLSPRPASTT
ncbi:MAG: BREX system serine/threonine kinase PglW [Planctomycetes bacterium]|nr:BREX system serine/threonine kinase PglW [Planctomycetota bacterium]